MCRITTQHFKRPLGPWTFAMRAEITISFDGLTAEIVKGND